MLHVLIERPADKLLQRANQDKRAQRQNRQPLRDVKEGRAQLRDVAAGNYRKFYRIGLSELALP